MQIIKTPINFIDHRGQIIDLIEDCNINAITAISFNPGAIRANHFHKKTVQWNYLVSGVVRIVTKKPGEIQKEYVLRPGDLVKTEALEEHALQGLENSLLIVFTQGPRGGKEYESDTYRLTHPLI